MNSMSSNDSHYQNCNLIYQEDHDISVLDNEIQAEEVYKAVKSLQNQKACGIDGINNEMLKIACHVNFNIWNSLI